MIDIIDAKFVAVEWICVTSNEGEKFIPDSFENADRQELAEWERKGNVIKPYSHPANPVPTLQDYENAIQNLVDQVAGQKQFRDGVTMASYVASTNEAWAAEAQAFVAWRDVVWGYAYAELAKVQGGEREQPTVEEFLTEIEPIVWPAA